MRLTTIFLDGYIEDDVLAYVEVTGFYDHGVNGHGHRVLSGNELPRALFNEKLAGADNWVISVQDYVTQENGFERESLPMVLAKHRDTKMGMIYGAQYER